VKPIKEVFTDIYNRRGFGGTESYSGEGSNVGRTAHLRGELQRLLQRLSIETLLDIPCGDFNWMSKLDLAGIYYMGADIVEELVQGNRRQHKESFRVMDIMVAALPKVDLILCRDCLVHFHFDDIFKALRNMCRSGSDFLLTTTFPARDVNVAITTGRWRTLNLEIAPFNLPPPRFLINEQCPVVDPDGMTYPDKSLGLWRIDAIRRSLEESHLE
jgi:SAM-dependent methyltransferase